MPDSIVEHEYAIAELQQTMKVIIEKLQEHKILEKPKEGKK